MRSTIFMIYGMWAGPWVWDRFMPFFSERGYRCAAPTLRYHDAPPEQPPAQLGRVSLLDYAADLQLELDNLGKMAGPPILMGHSMGGMLGQLPPGDRRAVYDRLVHESGRAACETGFWFLDPHRAKYADASRIAVPVLVVAGGRDLLHPPAMLRWVAERYEPDSAYKEFARSGHWLTGEPGWPRIAEYVADWLGKLEPAVPHQGGLSEAPVS